MDQKITRSQLAGSTEVALLAETIGRAFDKTVERYPEVEALVVRHQNIRWTYREYTVFSDSVRQCYLITAKQ
jgi:fatty-acyl-CoA synthase